MAEEWNVIFSYTQKQAIEDGVLIDVTEQSAEIGFKVNTCVTDHLYGDYLAPPAGIGETGPPSLRPRTSYHRRMTSPDPPATSSTWNGSSY